MSNSFAEILIKPASMRCNLACDYCFYVDESKKRECQDKGIMSKETATQLISRAFELPVNELCFTFQGGEPTLAGIEFFEFFINEANRLNQGKRKLLWSMQTNGTLITKEWADFLKANDFLVGISIDGPKEVHDMHRGKGSYQKVLAGLNELKSAGIVPNVLCVVTNNSNAKECYELYKELGLYVQQYIPCLESMGEENVFLSPSSYGTFLCELYDLWIKDLKAGKNISIRYFENLALMLNGQSAESCNFCGGCQLQFVTEANGDVYPCDFYCIDEMKLGNIHAESYIDMANKEVAKSFARKRSSTEYDDECRFCSFFKLCKAGCRRESQDRAYTQFCKAYKQLFEHIKQGI